MPRQSPCRRCCRSARGPRSRPLHTGVPALPPLASIADTPICPWVPPFGFHRASVIRLSSRVVDMPFAPSAPFHDGSFGTAGDERIPTRSQTSERLSLRADMGHRKRCKHGVRNGKTPVRGGIRQGSLAPFYASYVVTALRACGSFGGELAC